MLGASIKRILFALIILSVIGFLGVNLVEAEDYPFGVYGSFESPDIDTNPGRDSLYRQIAACGFNHVFVGIDSTYKDFTSIDSAGLKAYFVEQSKCVAYWYSTGHYTKWEAEGTEIAGYSLQSYGGSDSNGIMIWRTSQDSAGVVLKGPIRGEPSDTGYYQCHTYQWNWDTLGVSWIASFRMKINDNSGADSVAKITLFIMKSNGEWYDSSLVLLSNNFPNNEDTNFTMKYSFNGLVSWVLGKVKYEIYWFNTRDLYIDKIEVFDDSIGVEIASETDLVANSIKNYAGGFKDSNQVAGFLLADEPPTIDRLNTYRFVDSLLERVCDSLQVNNLRGITAYAENLSNVAPPRAKYFLEISKPYIFMNDIYPLYYEWEAFSMQEKIDKLCEILDTLRRETISEQKEFYYISQAFGYTDSTWINPTPNEMECFMNLGLAYKTDGIVLFNYNDSYDSVIIGLVDSDNNFSPRENWYRVQAISPKVKFIGSILRELTWQGTCLASSDDSLELIGCGAGYIDSLRAHNSADTIHYVQVGFFEDQTADTSCFMLVNRECDSLGGANYDVFLNEGPYRVREIYTDSVVGEVCGNGDYFTVYLGPGEGKLFRLEPRERIIRVRDDYEYIQEAIYASCDGDTVLVEPDTFPENINFLGKAITLASHFILDDHDSALIDSTVIDGSGALNQDSASVVTFNSKEDSASVLIGFTLTGGAGTKVSTVGPKTYYDGGGIYCDSSSPLIVSNKIVDNNVYKAGSTVYGRGGGINGRQNSNPRVINNLVSDNSADNGFGGGIYFEGSYAGEPIIIGNTIAGNEGGGIVIDGTYPLIANNIVVRNVNGYGVNFVTEPGNSIVSYNDVWNNLNDNFYNCPSGVGSMDTVNFNGTPCDTFFNVVQQPMFVDSTSDYHLQESSPCINAGGDGYVTDIYFDFDLNDRAIGCHVDMGAYEFWYLCGDANGDGDVSVTDVTYLINYLFKGGDPPHPMQAGDTNCDGRVSVSDNVYLINYLFKGGPPPCDN